MATKLTAALAHEIFDYVPQTGALRWKRAHSNRIKVGEEAGTIGANGRRCLSVDGERHMTHRVVWLMHKGELPTGNVAPKNGDYLDTRIENLFEETPAETARKGVRRSRNTSGVTGVHWEAARNKWSAVITRDYKRTNIGRFDSKEEAAAAYARAVEEYAPAIEAEDERRRLAELAAIRARQRALWNRTLKNAAGVTGWASIAEFVADVGSAPKANHVLIAVDPTKPIGPGNFAWTAPTVGWEHDTPEGRAAYQRAHRESNPLQYRDKELQKNFGIGLPEYHKMYDAQNGVCAICAKPETGTRGDKVKWLAVDHNHTTGALRGLLCECCNKMIGFAREDASTLRNAIAYLERFAAPPNERG